jgi:hypothetical protein
VKPKCMISFHVGHCTRDANYYDENGIHPPICEVCLAQLKEDSFEGAKFVPFEESDV